MSSWEEYVRIGKKANDICAKEIILEQFRNKSEYKEFATASLDDIVERRTNLKDIEKMLLE